MPRQPQILGIKPYQTRIPITPSFPGPTTQNCQETTFFSKQTEQQLLLLIQRYQ